MDTAKPGETSIMNGNKWFVKKCFCPFCAASLHRIINRSSDLVWLPHSSLSRYYQWPLDKERKPAGHSRLIMSIASGGCCKQAGSMVPLSVSNSSMAGRRSRKGSDWSRRMNSIPGFSVSAADVSESAHRGAWRVSEVIRWVPEVKKRVLHHAGGLWSEGPAHSSCVYESISWSQSFADLSDWNELRLKSVRANQCYWEMNFGRVCYFLAFKHNLL